MTDYQNELVMEHLDLVNWVIRTRISVPNRPLLTYDDFYAIGCEAICRAALKYQADSGEFAPFACRYIYNAIIDHCRAMNYRLQRSVDAGFEEGEVLFDLLAHTTVDFEAEVTDDSAMAALRACKEKYTDADTDRDHDIKWFLDAVARVVDVAEDGKSFTFKPKAKQKYFERQYHAFLDKACELTGISLDAFVGEAKYDIGMAMYKLNEHYQDIANSKIARKRQKPTLRMTPCVSSGSRMAASTPFTMMLSTSPSSLRRTGSMRSARTGIERANSRRRSPKHWSW